MQTPIYINTNLIGVILVDTFQKEFKQSLSRNIVHNFHSSILYMLLNLLNLLKPNDIYIYVVPQR